MKKAFWKSAFLFVGTTTFALGAGGGCLSAVVQRILVAANFD